MLGYGSSACIPGVRAGLDFRIHSGFRVQPSGPDDAATAQVPLTARVGRSAHGMISVYVVHTRDATGHARTVVPSSLLIACGSQKSLVLVLFVKGHVSKNYATCSSSQALNLEANSAPDGASQLQPPKGAMVLLSERAPLKPMKTDWAQNPPALNQDMFVSSCLRCFVCCLSCAAVFPVLLLQVPLKSANHPRAQSHGGEAPLIIRQSLIVAYPLNCRSYSCFVMSLNATKL